MVFCRGAITGVAGVVSGSVMLLVAEVVSQFSIQSTFNLSLGELLKQAVLTKQVIMLLLIFQ
jgi:hypothetical protein